MPTHERHVSCLVGKITKRLMTISQSPHVHRFHTPKLCRLLDIRLPGAFLTRYNTDGKVFGGLHDETRRDIPQFTRPDPVVGDRS